MKQQEQLIRNKRLFCLLLLVGLLCIGTIAASVGTAYARYREEYREGAGFQVREPERVLLGHVTEEGFAPMDSDTDTLVWREENGVMQLKFAVANGENAASYSARDQLVRLNVIGSPGVATEGLVPELAVLLPATDAEGEAQKVTATVAPIVEGTALYHTYGAGWLYTFYDPEAEGTQKLTWELPGGELSYIELTITIEGEIPESVSVLQPLISAEPVGD